MPDLKEQFLLFRIRQFRDEAAFGKLFETYKKELYKFLRTKLPTVEDTEDVVAMVFMRAWSYISTSHGNGREHHFRGLIYHIARNGVADYYRTHKSSVSIDALIDEGTQIADAQETKGKIEATTDVRLLKEQLNRLSPDQSEVIILRYFQGLEYAEIAKRLEKNEGAVRGLIHRALKELRKNL